MLGENDLHPIYVRRPQPHNGNLQKKRSEREN